MTLTVETADGRVHLLREVPDPHGDVLVLAVVLAAGSARSVARTRQRMAAVPIEALTAGPTLQRRPVDGRWQVDPAEPDVPAVPPDGLPGLEPVQTRTQPAPADGLPGLEPVVPKRSFVEPVDPVLGEPAPPPAMPAVVTPSPTPRDEPTGADV